MVANFIGVTAGVFLGLVARDIWAYVRKEWKTAEARRRLVTFPEEAVILREGDRVEDLFVIKSGQVRLSRVVDGEDLHLATAGPEEVVGTLGAIQGREQYTRVIADTRTVIYRMTLGELMDSAGGREQPVSLVLNQMADLLRDLADRQTEVIAREKQPEERQGAT